MINPQVSILLPHLRQAQNDKALRIALSCLVSNTSVDHELKTENVAERRDIYSVINRMAASAVSEWIVLMNSDHFVAPGWIEPFLAAAQPHLMLSCILVECGAIGVHTMNYAANFGMTPETFDRAAFEDFARQGTAWLDGYSWFWPVMLHRQTFLEMGGFDTSRGGFPAPLDFHFGERWQSMGRGFGRVKSYVYHLQNYSSIDEQAKPGRVNTTHPVVNQF